MPTVALRPVAAAALLALAAAPGTAAPQLLDGCLRALAETTGETIACEAGYTLPASLRGQLAGLTGGIVRGATCRMSVQVPRRMVAEAPQADGPVRLPAQPVACRLATLQAPMRARFTVAPEVWFEDGRAVRAEPGMAEVAGVPPAVGRLLQGWVNGSPLIRTAMVNAVNRFLERQAR